MNTAFFQIFRKFLGCYLFTAVFLRINMNIHAVFPDIQLKKSICIFHNLLLSHIT